MANEVTFGYQTGESLTFAVYTSAGVERESGTAMTETPASSGLYLGTPTTIVAGDLVVIDDGTRKVGWGPYQPEVDCVLIEGSDFTDTIIGADGDTLETISDQLDALSSEGAKVLNVYREGE